MPAFNFKRQFVEPIRAGTKRHTIRGERKDGRIPAEPGDELMLYCGMRTKDCFRILPGRILCTHVQEIVIRECQRCDGTGEVAHSSTHYESCPALQILIDGIELGLDEREQLARADGFNDFPEMVRFWDGRLPFKGYIIHWRAL